MFYVACDILKQDIHEYGKNNLILRWHIKFSSRWKYYRSDPNDNWVYRTTKKKIIEGRFWTDMCQKHLMQLANIPQEFFQTLMETHARKLTCLRQYRSILKKLHKKNLISLDGVNGMNYRAAQRDMRNAISHNDPELMPKTVYFIETNLNKKQFPLPSPLKNCDARGYMIVITCKFNTTPTHRDNSDTQFYGAYLVGLHGSSTIYIAYARCERTDALKYVPIVLRPNNGCVVGQGAAHYVETDTWICAKIGPALCSHSRDDMYLPVDMRTMTFMDENVIFLLTHTSFLWLLVFDTVVLLHK